MSGTRRGAARRFLHGRIGTLAVGGALLAAMLLGFHTLFPSLQKGAFDTVSQQDSPDNIAQSLNFLNEDKKAFLTYCAGFYGTELPCAVDVSTFVYYGGVDGYRLYRMQSTLIETGPARQQLTLNGAVFTSDRLYRPFSLGLYLVKDGAVYDLETAAQYALVNTADVYALFAQKSGTASAAG